MTVFGPDVSHYQGVVDWHALAAARTEGFAVAKASQGMTVDDRFAANRAGSLLLPVRGAYHFGNFAGDPRAQAQVFVTALGKIQPGDLLFLDAEDKNAPKGAASVAWIDSFLTTACQMTGLPRSRVGVYTGAWWWNPFTGGSSRFADRPLWVSGYNGTPGAAIPPKADIPTGFPGAVLWQYTNKARVAGISTPVDRSVYAGTIAQLRARAGNPIPVLTVPRYAGPFGGAHAVGHQHSAQIKAVQKGLGTPQTGTWSALDQARCVAYQKARPWLWNRRSPHWDGVVGPLTYRSLAKPV